MEEQTIDFKDLLKRICLQLKTIIIFMIAFIVVFAGIGVMQSARAAQSAKAQLEALNSPAEKNDLSSYTEKLSAREIAEVQQAVASYRKIQNQYSEENKYYSESLKMQIDPNNVPTLRLQYQVDNNYQARYPIVEARDTTEDIANNVCEVITDSAVTKKIADALNYKGDLSYIQELLYSTWYEGVVTIRVVAPDRKSCEKISEILQEEIALRAENLTEIFGKFDLNLLSAQYLEKADTDLLDLQVRQASSINTINNSLSSLTYTMTDNQKAYYKALLDNEYLQDSSSKEMEEKMEAEIVVPSVRFFRPKYWALGAAVGIFLGCAWIVLVYILSAKLRVAADIQKMYGIAVLGQITDKKKNTSKLFRNPYSRFNYQEQLRIIVSGIYVAAKRDKYSNLLIVSSAASERAQETCEAIRKAAFDKGIRCITGRSMIYDPESAEELLLCDGVIFVEQIDVSGYDEIAKEKELCEKYHVPIIGCAVIE